MRISFLGEVIEGLTHQGELSGRKAMHITQMANAQS